MTPPETYHIRTTKTASGATAVQVVHYEKRKLVVVEHIGSAHNENELDGLKQYAENWITQATQRQALFDEPESIKSKLIGLEKCQYLGIRYTFIYEAIYRLMAKFQFTSCMDKLVLDLVVMRLIEPASKLQSIELMEKYFGVVHRRQTFYEKLPEYCGKTAIIKRLVTKCAAKEFDFDCSLVFYDVTTLYFESFEADELRKPGFSKDGKSNQPQIIVGLMVNNLGFPVGYEIFEGNKFEGHTMIPSIKSFRSQNNVTTMTVVADAGMISMENILALKEHQLSYIVGARVANLQIEKIQEIAAELNREDGKTTRIQTKHGTLICDFSAKRQRKDQHEIKKQLKKAEFYMKSPAAMKKTRFLKTVDSNRFEINEELKKKAELLCGIKGYYTNLVPIVNDQLIIRQYRNLWHVEQAFRIAKNDLETRPIYHFKEQAIAVHLLICFMALALSKYIEIKTSRSIRHVIKEFMRITDATILDTLSRKVHTMRINIPESTLTLLAKLNLPY